MTTRVLIEVAGGSAAEANALPALPATVEEGEALLIGRDPDQARLGPLAADLPSPRTTQLSAPSVSANHLLVAQQGGETILVDAGSRNGTWLKLPPGDRVRLRTGQLLELELAAPLSSESSDRPRDASWNGSADYPRAIAAAARAWFERAGLAVRIEIKKSEDAADPRTGATIPLAKGQVLCLSPEGTLDAGWNHLVTRLWSYVTQQNALYLAEEATESEGMILASPAIRRAHRQVIEAAQRGLRLLLVGPSGSGKDGLARCYHRHSGRSGPFVAKNCAMFSRELLRSELFGAEAGAFTHAVRRIVGAVESAQGGTLFLDEIGEMPGDVQPLLLTFLDRGEYERMGSYGQVRTADVCVVAATNRDLRAATLKGAFRDDLWYRLAGCVVEVPPLRERPEDLDEYLRMTRLDGGLDAHRALSPGARARVLAHPWAGNFRELKSFVARLPGDPAPGGISEASCQAALDSSSLISSPPASPRPEESAGELDLAPLARAAADSFREDHGHGLRRWDDVKECLERFLKPLLFAELSGAGKLARREDAEIPRLASAIDADRGTVTKQLARYFERFKP